MQRVDRYDRVIYCGGAGPWACTKPTIKTAYNSYQPTARHLAEAAQQLVASVEPKPVQEVQEPIPTPVPLEAPIVAAPPAVENVAPQLEHAQVEAVPEKSVVFRNIMFDFNSFVIPPLGREVLEAYAPDLKRRRIELVGYTDNVGERSRNEEIAQMRALSVKQYLMSLGLSDIQIRIRGRGLCCYIASNKSDETRGLNRRVEIHLMGD